MSAPGQAPSAVPPRGAFVVGVPRSGTTLLVSLLDGHPELRLLPHETHVTEWCGQPAPVASLFAETRFDESLPPGSPERVAFERRLRERLPGPTDARTALLALMEVLWADGAACPEARLWVEKTPRHLRHVPELLRRFGPDTRVLCLVRDPRAVFASQARRWGREGLRAARQFARRWATADRLLRRYEAELPALRVLRYEDLVSRGEDSMRAVAAHLDISWNGSLLAPTYAWMAWAGAKDTGVRHPSVRTESVDRFRGDLQPAVLDELDRLLAGRMAHRGYAPGDPALSGPSLRRLALEAACLLRAGREGRGGGARRKRAPA